MKQIKLVRVRITPVVPGHPRLKYTEIGDDERLRPGDMQVSVDVVERWSEAETRYAAYQQELSRYRG